MDELLLPDEAALEAYGEALARRLPRGSVLLLAGPLGAGKTTLARGLGRGVGALAAVTSPTYALVHEYPTPEGPFVHIDAYRLEDPGKLWAMGLADLLERARLVAVEWGEALRDEIEGPRPLLVRLEPVEGGRRVRLEEG